MIAANAMRVLQVHNQYRIRGGEDTVVESTVLMLKRRGINVSVYTASSELVKGSLLGRVQAFGSSIYSFSAAADMSRMIRRERPDVVHVHNLYPLLSASVLTAGSRAGLPIVMTCHNFRLVCPIGIHLREGNVCELCVGGREFWCALLNCRRNIAESVAYALRSIFSRSLRLFKNNITLFVVPSDFGKRRLIDAGLSGDRVVVLPNMVSIPKSAVDYSKGEYAAYVGRISDEKDVDTLLAAAKTTGIPIRIAGDYSERRDLMISAPENVAFVGLLNRQDLDVFYRRSRYLVLPSKCFEMCPMVVLEAMSYGLPVIASDIGGLPELVEDEVTGLLFEPENAKELANRMRVLWDNPNLCRRMGEAGRNKTIREYGEDVYLSRLNAVYKSAIEIAGAKAEEPSAYRHTQTDLE